MIAFPLVTALVSVLCAGTVARDALRRPRPDKVIWAVAFLLFAIAAGTDAAGRELGWSVLLARMYYSTGPALVVAFLAIGQLYLLFPHAMRRFGTGATLLISVFWVSMVYNAWIDQGRLPTEGWEAIERGPAMVGITVAINSVGTLIIVGGTLWSVWRFVRRGDSRDKAIGCSLIAAGTIVVALGGTLTRLGHYEYLYIAMSVGVALIYLGVLAGRSLRAPGVIPVPPPVEAGPQPTAEMSPAGAHQALAEVRTALAFIHRILATDDDGEIDRMCTEWSVPRDTAGGLGRAEARRAWRLRTVLDDEGVTLFDRQTVAARKQLTILYCDVLAPERPGSDEITELVPASVDVSSRARHA